MGALLESARPGHCGNTGIGKPPPTTVPSVRHSGAVAFPKRIAQGHSAVQDTHARRTVYGQTKPIPGGRQGRGGDTRRDSGSGLAALSVGRNWQGVTG